MVVGDLHVAGISIFPDETDAVLVVDSGCCVAQTPQKSSCAASSNETPCFRRFAVAFRAFHSKRTWTFHLPSVYPSSRELTVDPHAGLKPNLGSAGTCPSGNREQPLVRYPGFVDKIAQPIGS